MLTVLAFCSVQSENGQSHACMRLLAHITGPELCRLLPLKNSSLHAKLGLFSDNRANFIVETDLMRVHFRHFRFVLLGLRIIFASGLSACSWTRFWLFYNYIEIIVVYLLKINVYTLAVLGLRWPKRIEKLKKGHS